MMSDGIFTPPHDHDDGNVHHDHDDVGKDNVHHVFGQAPFLSRLRLRRLLAKAKEVVQCHYLYNVIILSSSRIISHSRLHFTMISFAGEAASSAFTAFHFSLALLQVIIIINLISTA